MDNFGNGRYVRNLIERAMQKQAARLLETRDDVSSISKGALFLIEQDYISTLEEGLKDERVSGTAKQELEEMIGLIPVNRIIQESLDDESSRLFLC